VHEVNRIAEQALARAKKIREEGAPAVEVKLQCLDSFEQEVRASVSRNLGKLSHIKGRIPNAKLRSPRPEFMPRYYEPTA